MSARLLLLSLALPLTACGSVATFPDGPLPGPDATRDGATAAPRRSVIRAMALPIESNDTVTYGLDLDGDTRVDDQLAAVVIALHSASGFAPKPRIDAAIGSGELLLLAQYQPGPTGAFTLFKGANPVPAPCTPTGDCGQHLAGNATFTVAGDSPRDTPLTGAEATPFLGGPGALTIQLVVFGSHAFQLPLFGARVQVTESSPDGTITEGILAGAVSQSDVDNTLIPKFAHGMQEDVVADCVDLATPPGCGCGSGSGGEKWIRLFDANQSCVIEPDELAASDIIRTLLTADVTIDGATGFSVGVRFTAAPAQFTP